MASNRWQLALLGAIVVVFAGVVRWQMTRDQSGTPVPARAVAVAPAQGPVAPAASAARVPAVGLGALEEVGREPVDTGRDPFRFDAARVVAPGGGGGGAAGPSAPVAVGPVAPAGPVEPPGPPPPPPIQLRYIGTAKQGAGGKQLAVLRDDRGIYYGAEGDIIEGRYRILRVGADSVDVAYVDGRGRRTISLTGGQK